MVVRSFVLKTATNVLLAAVLLAGAEAEWSVKKGGLWWLTHRERDGKAQVVVRAVLAPDLL